MNVFDNPQFWVDLWFRSSTDEFSFHHFKSECYIDFPFEGDTYTMGMKVFMEGPTILFTFNVKGLFRFEAVYGYANIITPERGPELVMDSTTFKRKLVIIGDHDIHDMEHVVSLIVMSQEAA